jgi:hypothetical protein
MKELGVNQNVVTDLVWTPGTSWYVALNDVTIFAAPCNARSEQILAEFSGGLGRMHVGHLPVGGQEPGHSWRLQYHPNWWAPLECKSETKSVVSNIEPGDPAKIEKVNNMLRGQRFEITRMSVRPFSIGPWGEGYFVFVESQNWCPLFNGGYAKVIGYNNVLHVDWKRKEAALRWG